VVSRRQIAGFTLIEMVAVVAVMAILVSLAVPSFKDMILGVRVRTTASDVLQAVMLARSEAIKRATNVDVVPYAAGWTQGWSVMVGTMTIETHEAPGNVTVSANTAGNITFRLDGRVSTNVRSITVYTTESTGSIAARCVIIDASGRPTIRNDTDGNPANGC
jgi:type IV fimbrial biogenesis protein FimT